MQRMLEMGPSWIQSQFKSAPSHPHTHTLARRLQGVRGVENPLETATIAVPAGAVTLVTSVVG